MYDKCRMEENGCSPCGSHGVLRLVRSNSDLPCVRRNTVDPRAKCEKIETTTEVMRTVSSGREGLRRGERMIEVGCRVDSGKPRQVVTYIGEKQALDDGYFCHKRAYFPSLRG